MNFFLTVTLDFVVCLSYSVLYHVLHSGQHIFHQFCQQTLFLPTFSANFFFLFLWRQIVIFIFLLTYLY